MKRIWGKISSIRRRSADGDGRTTIVCVLRGPLPDLQDVIKYAKERGVLDAWKKENLGHDQDLE